MRQLGALLLEVRKNMEVKSLRNVLEPSNFDLLVKCTKSLAKYNPETESYGAPSLAANMGTLLKECIDVAYNISIKRSSTRSSDLNNLKTLKDIITNEWRYEVSTIAIGDLQQKKWNKPSLIPLAEDLKLLKCYLLTHSKKSAALLETNPYDKTAFKQLQEVTYVQLLLLNRRRVGELQRMPLASYTLNIENQASSEFDHCISESEKFLMKSFKRVVIRGKRGRGVPVLFTERMVHTTNLLVNLRQNFVPKQNIYLFANLKTTTPINGAKTIYKLVRSAGVSNAAAITSTKLRKHLATMSQVINLSPQDLEQLSSFMGHTSETHKSHYRLPNDIYQTAKVSKLLLLSEKGEASKFKGQNLDEIQINLEVEEDEEYSDEGDECSNILQDKTNEFNINHEEHTLATEDTSIRVQSGGLTKNRKRILEPWTNEQKNATLTHFKNHITSKIAPKKHECLELKKF